MKRKVNNKEERKQELQKLNEPPVLTILEEVGNAITHGVGAVLALVGFILLLLKSDTGMKVMASCFYGISLFIYASIYLLIGGTFAPLYLVYWGNTLGIVLFCIQWSLIVFGIIMLAIFGPGKWKWIHFTLYFTIGWSGLIMLPDFFHNNIPLLFMILIGGIVYTVGMVPFARDKKYDHFIWHFFVLIGALLHWFGIYLFVY